MTLIRFPSLPERRILGDLGVQFPSNSRLLVGGFHDAVPLISEIPQLLRRVEAERNLGEQRLVLVGGEIALVVPW
jgi:hypothetical protein